MKKSGDKAEKNVLTNTEGNETIQMFVISKRFD